MRGILATIRAIFAVMLTGIQKSVGKEEKEVFVAIESYSPAEGAPGNAMAFVKHDKFAIESTKIANWWKVKSVNNGQVGYVPSNFIVKLSDVECYEWISYDCDRNKAEGELNKSKYDHGSFIIRTKSKNFNSDSLVLCLSIKELQSAQYTIVHYEMERVGGGIYLGSPKKPEMRKRFDTLNLLVQEYAGRRKCDIRLTYSVKKKKIITPWEYDPAWVSEIKYLDGGSFGKVQLGRIFGREDVALKTAKDKRNEEEFMKEALIAKHCKHPNVLETYGICTSKLFIITEYMESLSLKKFLGKNQLSTQNCLSVALKIARGMEYLASRNIVHRDLAARNILVGASLAVIKVADFGLSRYLDKTYYITQKGIFPLEWTAPEGFVRYDGIINTKFGKLNSASDVWSFGVVMWELLTNGQEPYQGLEKQELYRKLKEESYRLQPPETCPEDIKQLMRACWQLEWKARPTFAEICALLEDRPTTPATATSSSTVSTPSSPRLSHSATDEEDTQEAYLDPPLEGAIEIISGTENSRGEEVRERVPIAELMLQDDVAGELVRPTTFHLNL